ncbi:MAG TPA: Ig-like domain-containing protein [Longimicrobium sp.]|nr:Ig-like domain-containing protein [Longimicrobium sp.]
MPVGLAALLAWAVACTDRSNPVAPVKVQPKAPAAARIPIQLLDCTISRQEVTLQCVASRPHNDGMSGILLGNQGVNVQLTSSNVAYNSTTEEYTFDVTVKNLIEQPIGTTDGSTVATGGVRVFFTSGPTVTSGSGSISVVADGTDFFTAANQAYYEYDELLAQNATSAAHGWKFLMPPSVGTFSFTVMVSAPVQYPAGYITLDGHLPGYNFGSLHPDSAHTLVYEVKNAFGAVQSGLLVSYSTSDAACATVDYAGTVTGVRLGTCTISASDGSHDGSMVFSVTGTTRTWTGAASSNWDVGSNWTGGVTPATEDSVLVPTGVPNFPALASDVTVSDVTVDDLASIDVGAFSLTSTGNVATGPTVGWGIFSSSTGQVLLTGTARTMQGRFPKTRVSGTYTVNGRYWGRAPQTINGGRVTVSGVEMHIHNN